MFVHSALGVEDAERGSVTAMTFDEECRGDVDPVERVSMMFEGDSDSFGERPFLLLWLSRFELA